ncbi:MAG: M48 family metalloprotease [Candidatus Omnitrophota bacterium]
MITQIRNRLHRFNISICHLPFAQQGVLGTAVCYLLLAGCITSEYNVGTHRHDTMLYSTAKEAAMGANIARKIADEFKLSKSPYDIERINTIGRKVAAVCDRKEINYYFYVIEEDDKGKKDEKNAFSVPGGYVYIFKALMDDLTDEELAYVLAHEVSHVVSRHGIKRLQAAMGYNLLMVAAVGARADPEFVNGLSFALAQLIAGYSREDEFNADELAAKYLKMVGYDPRIGIDVLEKLYKENKKEIRPLSYFRTHPYTAERIRHIKETLHLPIDVNDFINS